MLAHEIHKLLDNHLHGLSTLWVGSLLFKLHPCPRNYEKNEVLSLLKAQPQTIDICNFIGGKYPDVDKLYFDPSLYHPPKNF